MRRTLDGKRCAAAGELRAELERSDRELLQIGARQARGAGAFLLFGLAHGLALDVEPCDPQLLDHHVSHQ